jgi:hypothetical protein
MTSISITPLSTSNTAPTLTGYVDFQRFDSIGGNPKETISVYVNYRKYTLFDGNLGLDETVKPNKWKLHFSQNLVPGTYQVEAYVSDIASNTIIASETKEVGLTITQPTPVEIKQQNPTLLEKVATVALLMASLDKLFGGKNGIAPVPSVHPVINDEASTALLGRGNEEANEDTVRKSKGQTQRKGNVKANPVKNKVVDPAAASAIPAASLDKVAGAMLENGTSAGVEMDLETVKTEMSSTSSPTDVIETLNEAAATRAGLRGITSNEQFNVPQYDALGMKIN